MLESVPLSAEPIPLGCQARSLVLQAVPLVLQASDLRVLLRTVAAQPSVGVLELFDAFSELEAEQSHPRHNSGRHGFCPVLIEKPCVFGAPTRYPITIEADVIVNNDKRFNCYRGPRRLGSIPETSNVFDVRRVGTHELGHVLGLGHPDDIGQVVEAIMNGLISDIDAVQLDDIQGVLTLYGVAVTGILFPPRDQVVGFFLSLEAEYRDTLSRSRTSQGFVDAEGSAVWFPEWLRYRLNGCSAREATDRALLQLRGQGIQPVCSVVPRDVINFPPRNESFDFLSTLDRVYQNELGRTGVLSYVDLEGRAVWLQEYLRYRVKGCDDNEALARVRQQIRIGDVPPTCSS